MNDQVKKLDIPLSKTQMKKLKAQNHNENMRANLVEEVPITLEQREELEALSKEVFGSTSHYATILHKGTLEVVTEDVQEYVPATFDAEGKELTPEETRVVQVNIKYRSPKRGLTTINQLRTVRYNAESVKSYMLDIKAKQEALRTAIKKMNDDRQAAADKAKLSADVQKAVGGSAL